MGECRTKILRCDVRQDWDQGRWSEESVRGISTKALDTGTLRPTCSTTTTDFHWTHQTFERQQLISKKIGEDETFTSSVTTTASEDWWLDVAQARASMGGRERGRRVFEDGVTCACNNKQWRSETRSAPRLAFTNSKRVYTSHIRRDLIRRSQVKVILSGLFFSWECSCIRCYIQFIHFECKRSFAKIRRTVGVSELGQF